MQANPDRSPRPVCHRWRYPTRLVVALAVALLSGAMLTGAAGAAPSPTLALAGVATTTTTTVVPKSTLIPFGKRTTVQVTVSPEASGSVTLKTGSITVGTAGLSEGIATFTLPTSLPVGRHTISAVYGGYASFGASSGAKAVDVVRARPGGFAVTLSPATVTGSQQTTVRVHLVGSGATVGGAVRILVNGTARAAFSLRSGVGEVRLPRLAAGVYVINARYDGDANFAPTVSGTARLTVRATSTVRPVPGSNPITYGRSLPVTVTASAPGVTNPTGSVTLLANGHSMGTKTLRSGSAQFTVGLAFNPGRYPLKATYSGSTTASASVGVKAFDVVKARPGVGIALSDTSITTSQRVRATTSVSSGPAAATGVVRFLVDGVVRGSKNLNSAGRALIDLPTLGAGNHHVVVSYGGDRRYTPSVSGTGTVSVTAPFLNGCRSSARACVDLTHNKAWVQQNGKIIYGPVPMLSGRPGYRTSAGTFSVYWKDIDHKSSIFDDAPMPYAIFFDGGTAFHEGSLNVLSHGCIHLSHSAASYFWNALDYGDSVQVFGYAPY